MLRLGRSVTAALLLVVVAPGCAACPRGRALRGSTLALTSADVGARPKTLSCRGAAFCREDVVTVPDEDATEELIEACAQHGGSTSWTACRREGVVASCAVSSGELGPVLVLTYAQPDAAREADAVAKVSEICEHFEGSFARVRR